MGALHSRVPRDPPGFRPRRFAVKFLGQFGWVRRIACPSENVLYIADENKWRVQKLLLHPERTRTTALHR